MLTYQVINKFIKLSLFEKILLIKEESMYHVNNATKKKHIFNNFLYFLNKIILFFKHQPLQLTLKKYK